MTLTPDQRAHLEATRRLLDGLDDTLVDLLARRAEVVAALWAWKARQGLDRADPGREAEVLQRLLARALARGLDVAAVEPVLQAVVGRPLRKPPPGT
ncbi:MAG: chorismate mutase [Myxococcaceae bacterium]|jgi:chorismate mutase|nr:chorismate mutase [Myxococcaceae bacterium]MCA3011828.1 chorismate mutase [Myxococcaceae bacterium]